MSLSGQRLSTTGVAVNGCPPPHFTCKAMNLQGRQINAIFDAIIEPIYDSSD
jgi:hypothetical protein